MDGWKTIRLSFWGPVTFQGAFAVKLLGCNDVFCFRKKNIEKKRTQREKKVSRPKDLFVGAYEGVHFPSQRKVTEDDYFFLGGEVGASPTSRMNNLNVYIQCKCIYLIVFIFNLSIYIYH